MQKTRRTASRETFSDVFRRKKALTLILTVIIVMLLLLSFAIKISKSNNKDFHSGLAPKVLDLKPLAVEGEDGKGAVLTETSPVDDAYFADALFVGDSLCDGIRVYADVFPGYRTVTKVGLGIDATLYMEFPNVTSGQTLTTIGHIEVINPSVLYIMLGTNDMVYNEPSAMIASYEVFVNEVMAKVPGCKIVAQSIPPATKETAETRTGFALERITKFNEELRALAVRKGIYFLDVHSAIVGEDGYMPVDIAAPDGIHMKPTGYQMWRDFLKTHTIQGDAAFSIGADGFIKFTAA